MHSGLRWLCRGKRNDELEAVSSTVVSKVIRASGSSRIICFMVETLSGTMHASPKCVEPFIALVAKQREI